ncbi:hypothetical protein B0H19DRAFT_1070501 [Mycena capillaripes]|nr:hypothetical protein B0H19DRAFT_1070501 [Mycena capillaripes]
MCIARLRVAVCQERSILSGVKVDLIRQHEEKELESARKHIIEAGGKGKFIGGRTTATAQWVHIQEDVAALLGAEADGLDGEEGTVWDAPALFGDGDGEREVENPLGVGLGVGVGVGVAAAASLSVYHGSTRPEYVCVNVEAPPGATNLSTHVPTPSAPEVQDSERPLARNFDGKGLCSHSHIRRHSVCPHTKGGYGEWAGCDDGHPVSLERRDDLQSLCPDCGWVNNGNTWSLNNSLTQTCETNPQEKTRHFEGSLTDPCTIERKGHVKPLMVGIESNVNEFILHCESMGYGITGEWTGIKTGDSIGIRYHTLALPLPPPTRHAAARLHKLAREQALRLGKTPGGVLDGMDKGLSLAKIK